MKPYADIHPAKVCSRALALFLGLLMPAATDGAAVRLEARLPASIPPIYPVSVDLTLENVGNQPIVIEDFPRPHLLRVDLTRVSTGTLEYQGFANLPIVPDERQLRPGPLAPGQTAQFGIVLATKWGPLEQPIGPVFNSTGLFKVQFIYPLHHRENQNIRIEDVRSSPVTVLVTNVSPRHQAVLNDVRTMPQLVWLMQPGAADFARPGELEAFETSLRQLLGKHPNSPWTSLAQFALATRLHVKFVRAGYEPPALGQEITNLLNGAQAEGQLYRDDAARLQKQMERIFEKERSRVKSKAAPPVVAQTVADQFQKLLGHIARGETNFIQPLLLSEFRYNDQLNAADWLAKLKRENAATGPFPMAIHFKTVSITGPDEETVLTADVTFESGVRKSVRRVAATYQLKGKSWLLTAWKNVGVTEP